MKNMTSKMIIAAATLVAAAGVASAQDMEAKIPFAFRAGGRCSQPERTTSGRIAAWQR
jgi:hypothetical protein